MLKKLLGSTPVAALNASGAGTKHSGAGSASASSASVSASTSASASSSNASSSSSAPTTPRDRASSGSATPPPPPSSSPLASSASSASASAGAAPGSTTRTRSSSAQAQAAPVPSSPPGIGGGGVNRAASVGASTPTPAAISLPSSSNANAAAPPASASASSSPSATDSLPASALRLKLASAPAGFASPFALVSSPSSYDRGSDDGFLRTASSSAAAAATKTLSSSSSSSSTVSSVSPATALPPLPSHIHPCIEWGVWVTTLAGAVSAIQRHANASSSPSLTAASPTSPDATPEEKVAAFLAKQAAKSADDDDDDDDDTGTEDNDDDNSSSSFSVPTSLESARFHFPCAVCPSRQEVHLLVADSRRIAHVNTARKVVGTLSSVVQGACGLHRDHTGSIWIADTRAHCIRRVTPKGELIHVAGSRKGNSGYRNGEALQARFNEPMSLCSNGRASTSASASASDSGTPTSSAEKAEPFLLFVADAGNCAIRIIFTDKGVVSTLAGPGPEAPLPLPLSLSTPNASSSSSHSRPASAAAAPPALPPSSSSDPSSSPLLLRAIDGPLAMATFLRPVCVAFDFGDSSLVICDAGAHSLRRLTVAGLVWTLAGGSFSGDAGFQDGAAFRARFSSPSGVAIDSLGRIFVADKGNHAIRIVTPSGFVHTIAGDGTPGLRNGSGLQARFYGPTSLALNPQGGELFVTDGNNHSLRKISFLPLPPPRNLEVGNTNQVLIREWVEFKEGAQVVQRRLEGEVTSLRQELTELRGALVTEFAKVREEQMQIMSQLLSSLQAITSDRKL